MKIFIDGDGSPTKQETIQLAKKYDLPVVLVTSIDHFSKKPVADHVETVYVERGADSADFKILSMISAGDIVVTQDYGLASLALAKAIVIHHSGMIYTDMNIDQLLRQRYENQQMRKAKMRTKGPKPFTAADRQHFIQVLDKIIQDRL
ncbi:YaiI/YqxD family protein [Aerococcus viridans]|uniref:YaiI/YqxD family protein n=1 Tax=Aerococcus viridans TaxID=1377 RepID=UPI002DBD3CDF|nr:YaiI/YqxD family protein [Aerococcus viridans]MEC1386429.1 YaiI/YqxD family protein [Aerococcus viridans]